MASFEHFGYDCSYRARAQPLSDHRILIFPKLYLQQGWRSKGSASARFLDACQGMYTVTQLTLSVSESRAPLVYPGTKFRLLPSLAHSIAPSLLRSDDPICNCISFCINFANSIAVIAPPPASRTRGRQNCEPYFWAIQ
jgi:hypothetical protein